MNNLFLSSLLALSAAAFWGAGDFSGGLATRRSNAFQTVLFSYSMGLVLLVIIALARGEQLTTPADLGWGVLAGLSGMIGIGFLFMGFARGRMGIVSPVSAILGSAIPVIFNGFTEGLPSPLRLAGFAVALVGIGLLSRPERQGIRPDGLGLAFLAGLGFAGFFICLDQVGGNAVFWPLAAGRLAACGVMLLVALVTHRSIQIRKLPWGLLALVGVLDVTGNLLFLLAVQNGRLDVSAVLVSLYPAMTALLAWAIIKERLTKLQVAGVGAAILAIMLISV